MMRPVIKVVHDMPDKPKNVYFTIEDASQLVVKTYFDTIEDALATLRLPELGPQHTVYLGFGPKITIENIDTLSNTLKESELVIFLQGNPTFSDNERYNIYQKVLLLSNERSGNLHIFLMNRAHNQSITPFALGSLKLAPNPEDEPFTPLSEGQGYYLSSKDVFSRIFKNKQRTYEINNTFPIHQSQTSLEAVSQQCQQTEPTAGVYLTEKAEPDAVRPLKSANKQQVKAYLKCRVSTEAVLEQHHSQESALNQTQSLTQQQTLNQTHALNQNINAVNPVEEDIYSWFEFEKLLIEEAERKLEQEYPIYQQLYDKGYLTDTPNLYQTISADWNFRQTVLSHIYGVVYKNEFDWIPLPRKQIPLSVSMITQACANKIIKNLSYYMDNFDSAYQEDFTLRKFFSGDSWEKYKTFVLLGERFMLNLQNPYHANVARSQYRDYPLSNLKNHRAMPLLSGLPSGFERHMQPYALLEEESLEGLDTPKKQAITTIAERLLYLFSNQDNLKNIDCNAILCDFLALIQFYFKDKHEEYSELLTRLMGLGRDDPNAYKILLHVPLVGGRTLLEMVLIQLQSLDKKSLLPFFYQLFLKKQKIVSISDAFIKNPRIDNEDPDKPCIKNTFLQLARITPAVDKDQWPAFYKFYHHYLLFLSIHGIDTTETVEDFETHWHKTKTKFLNYTQQNEAKSQQLLERLTAKLIDNDGFKLHILAFSADILAKLDRIIDAAILNNTLEEQIDNIAYLSLCTTDAIYALEHDGLKVASSEMGLRLSLVDENTNKFSVSLQELEAYLRPPLNDLSTHIFRYLGVAEAREPLEYYRHLFNELPDTEIGKLLKGWMVLRSTGPYFNPSEAIGQTLIELEKTWREEALNVEDGAKALAFFFKALPTSYDFKAISLLLRLIKTDLHHFEPHRFWPLILKIKQWHQRYDSQLIDLFELLLQHQDLAADFKVALTHLKTADHWIEKLRLEHQEALLLLLQKRAQSPQNNSTSLLQQFMQHPDMKTCLQNHLKTLPPIIIKPFFIDNISNFIQTNQIAIEDAIRALEALKYRQSHYPIVRWVYALFKQNRETDIKQLSRFLSETLLKIKIKSSCPNHTEIPIQTLLKKFYPTLGIGDLARSFKDIDPLISNLSQLATLVGGKPSLFNALNAVFLGIQQAPMAVALTEIILHQRNELSTKLQLRILIKFLFALSKCQRLLALQQERFIPLIQLLLTEVLSTPSLQHHSHDLFIIIEKLLARPDHSGTVINTLEAFFCMASAWQDDTLIANCRNLNGQQLHFFVDNILQLQDANLAKAYLSFISTSNHQDHFHQLAIYIPRLAKEKKALILSISLTVCSKNNDNMSGLIIRLNPCSLVLLARIETMVNKRIINGSMLSTLLKQPSIEKALDQIEIQSRSRQLTHLDVDIEQVIQKINEISYKPLHEDEDISLDYRERKQLLADFVSVISLLKDKPIAVKTNASGAPEALSIYDLSQQEFQLLLKKCRQILNSKTASLDSKHQANLICLTLSCVAMSQTLGKTPTYVQLLAVLNSMNHSGNIIHEISTGGGKSMISALHAVWLWACGKTVTVTTCNAGLGARDAAIFNPFYQYLGIEAAQTLITPNSARNAYMKDAIHYSTGPNLALFIKNRHLRGEVLPDNPAMIADEVDAALKTLVESRVAATIDPIFSEKKKWSFIYPTIIDFVNEAAIFSNNLCSKSDDISNLRTYLKVNSATLQNQHHISALHDFIETLPDNLLNDYLDAAMVANGLEENVDYQVLTFKKEKATKGGRTKKYYHYAAPILDSTKRPDRSISWSDGVQQLLHAKLKKQSRLSGHPYKFIHESHCEDIAVVSAKNLFDYFFLNNGRIIGLTATAGGLVETQEFYQQNKFTSFSHPSFHPDKCTILPLETAPNQTALYQHIFQKLISNAALFPGQPVLLFMESAKIARELHDYLNSKTCQKALQTIHAILGYFDGSDKDGQSETKFIHDIGKNGHQTIATESLARGADPATVHPEGLFVINTCVNITQSDLRQIRGRTARNGKPGKFLCLLNTEQLQQGLGKTAEEKFSFLQKQKEALKTKERLKLAALNDIRHYVIENCYLAFKNKVEHLYQRQQGLGKSLLNTHAFYQALCGFNKKMDCYYKDLIENGMSDDAETLKHHLITKAVGEYNVYLNQAVKDEELLDFQVIEPLVSINKILELPAAVDALKVKHLAILSLFFSTIWQTVGNHKAVKILHVMDINLDTFKSFFANEQHQLTMVKLIGIFLYHSKFWELENIKPYFDDTCHQTITEALNEIPMIGEDIPKAPVIRFIQQYLQKTTAAIKLQQWDALDWPEIDFNAIYGWAIQAIGQHSRLAKYSIKALKAWHRNTPGSFYGLIDLLNPQHFFSRSVIIPLIKKCILWLGNLLPSAQKEALTQMVSTVEEWLPVVLKTIKSLQQIDWSHTTVNTLLVQLQLIFNNELVLKFFKTTLSQTSHSALSPFLSALPALPSILSPFADLTLKECLNTQNILQIIVQFSQLKEFQEGLVQESLKDAIRKWGELDTSFFEPCKSIGAIAFLQLTSIIAHPRFNEFLAAIPGEVLFGTIRQWLLTSSVDQHLMAEAIPASAVSALENLKHYQADSHRIEQQSRQEMALLKQQFHLSAEKIKMHLAHLAQQPIPRLSINHRALKKEEALPLVIAPFYLESTKPERTEPAQIMAPKLTIPSVDAFIAKPVVIQKHLEQMMLQRAHNPSSQGCNRYIVWLCKALLNPQIDFNRKKLLPEKILPIISKLTSSHDNQSSPMFCALLKKTAIHLLADYQKSWFISFDRRKLVGQLLINIANANDSGSIQQSLIEAKKTLYNNDYQTDMSFFNQLFNRLRNSKGYSRLHERLEVLSTTASAILLAEGNTNQYESYAVRSFTSTFETLLAQLKDSTIDNKQANSQLTPLNRGSNQHLEKLQEAMNHAPTVQDQQHLMNATCDALADIEAPPPRPSIKMLINSLTKATLLQRTVTSLEYVPTLSLRSPPEITA